VTPNQEVIGPCEICGEIITMLEVEMGQVAEMFNPKFPEQGGICHGECGVGNGWEVA
jgi:hypothetical protein